MGHTCLEELCLLLGHCQDQRRAENRYDTCLEGSTGKCLWVAGEQLGQLPWAWELEL